MKRLDWTVTALATALVLVVMMFLVSGCTAQQIQRDEQAVHNALVRIEQGINWAQAHPDVVNWALDDAAKVDPGNPTLQAVVSKAKAGVAAGDLNAAHAIVQGGVVLTAPTPAPVPSPSPSPGAGQ